MNTVFRGAPLSVSPLGASAAPHSPSATAGRRTLRGVQTSGNMVAGATRSEGLQERNEVDEEHPRAEHPRARPPDVKTGTDFGKAHPRRASDTTDENRQEEDLQERHDAADLHRGVEEDLQERRDAADLHHGVEEDLQERQGRADRPHAHAQTRDGRLGQQGAARCRDTEQLLRITRTPTQTQTQTLMPKPTLMPTLRCARSKCERTYRVWAQGKCVSISMSAIPVVRHRCNGGGAATGGACGGLGGR